MNTSVIKVANGINKKSIINQEVVSYKTNNPLLVVHRTFNNNGWTITHTKTGYAIFRGISTRKLAILGANLFSNITDWNMVTVENANEIFNANHEAFMKVKDEIIK
jgi:hypothetical protein